MADTSERDRWVRAALGEAGLDALVCALPTNVLMLTGYWPVTGTAIAVATRDRTVALVPEDEADLARSAKAEVRCFAPGSLSDVRDVTATVRPPLADLLRGLGLSRAAIGLERRGAWQPAPYSALHLYEGDLDRLLTDIVPEARRSEADDLLTRLRAVKTPHEVERIRVACAVAGRAFGEGARGLEPGLREAEAAARFRAPLSTATEGIAGATRADGFAWCMSGPNAALAFRSYARSSDRRIGEHDMALVHVNSCVDGYWTDLTRTYSLGDPDERLARVYEAVFAARAAALKVIRPGARGADVDRAARAVLEERGYGAEFKHPAGHGVGFLAIDHNAPPRLHPASPDTLQAGMVFNLEPAVYQDGWGGCRQCDMVAVTAGGAEVLSEFQVRPEDLVVHTGNGEERE